jgi:hypothetical protein
MSYKAVFRGEVLDGFDEKDVKAALAVRFRLQNQMLERLFSGHTVVVKSRLDLETAKKYHQVFHQAGALLRIFEAHIDPGLIGEKEDSERERPPMRPLSSPDPSPVQDIPADSVAETPVEAVFVEEKTEDGPDNQSGVERRQALGLKPATEVLNQYRQIIHDKYIHFPPIPVEKLAAASERYADIGSGETPLMLMDVTLTGNAKNGILVTDQRLYACELAKEPLNISIKAVHSVMTNGFPVKTSIHINGNKVCRIGNISTGAAEKACQLILELRYILFPPESDTSALSDEQAGTNQKGLRFICSNCGSSDCETLQPREKMNMKVGLVSSLIGGPLVGALMASQMPKVEIPCKCRQCGNEWVVKKK